MTCLTGTGSAPFAMMRTSGVTRRHFGFAILAMICLFSGSRVLQGQEVFGSGRDFSVDALGFPRARTVLSGQGLRVFAGRGSASMLDKTVTGVQWLIFPPVFLPSYRFLLSFRHDETQTLMRDAEWELYEYYLLTSQRSSPVPTQPNLDPDRYGASVLDQQCEWRPNEFFRTGTFYKRLKGKWVSFSIETSTRASGRYDEILMRVRLANRDQAPLNLTVLPEQTLFEPDLPPVQGITVRAARKFAKPNAYTLETAGNQVTGLGRIPRLAEGGYRVTVLSDLPQAPDGGWKWSLAPGQESTAYFSIFVYAKAEGQKPPASGLGERWEDAGRTAAERLQWAAKRLPSVRTANRALDELYYRSVLTILENKWDRADLPTNPFYALAPDWLFSIAWDISFLSRVMALADPDATRQTLLLFAKQGLHHYAQSLYATMQVLRDYLDQTGDTAILDATVGDSTLFDNMKSSARSVIERFARPDGLLQFGDVRALLETNTDGYEYTVGTTNGLMASSFRQIAAWCRTRHDGDAAEFEQEASRIEQQLRSRLWNEGAGWFENEFPDGSRHLVWSYHEFDLLGTEVLTDAQRRRMVGYLREGMFLGPYGMYGIAKADRVHWDLIDADFGGGGEYTAMPMRVVESLFASGQAELAWDILLRCARWVSAYPYLPQEIYTDDGSTIEVGEEPLHICGGAAAQAIVFGAFGLRPHADGSLEVAPAYHQSLGEAWLKGYRFRGHVYDVHLTSRGFEVFRDTRLVRESSYETRVLLP